MSLCGSASILLVALVCASAAEPHKAVIRPAIAGMISDDYGKAVSGATVMVWTAAPTKGYSRYCPSCYADCGKRAITDARGKFSFDRADPTLRFNLLVVHEGFAPLYLQKVEPFGHPALVRLKRRALPTDPLQVLRGKVVDPSGSLIAHAVVSPEEVWWKRADGTVVGTGGAVKGLDPLGVTNEKGEFDIAYTRPALKMTVCVFARGMAPKWFLDLPTGSDRHELPVSRGASIRGRLVQFGKPVPDAEIGLINKERGVAQHFPESRIGTQPDGTFVFANVPTPNGWFVYAKMNSILNRGATTPVSCRTSRDDEIIDLGDIKIQSGHRVRGRVVLTDSQPIAQGMRMTIGSTEAWDNQTVALPPDGRFEFRNLPTSEYYLSPSVKGYRLSDKNPNLSRTIEGRIDRDIDDFIILLDPGKDNFAGRHARSFKGKPLMSPLEVRLQKIDPKDYRAVTGRLVGADGKPLAGVELRLLTSPDKFIRPNQFPFNWTMIETGQLEEIPECQQFLAGVTGKDGEFTFPNVRVANYGEVAYWGKGTAPGRETIDVTADSEPVIKLTIRAEVYARLVVEIDRKAWPNDGEIQIWGGSRFFDYRQGQLVFDYRGERIGRDQERATFEDLPAGNVHVSFMGAGRDFGRSGIYSETLSQRKVTLKSGETTSIRFDKR